MALFAPYLDPEAETESMGAMARSFEDEDEDEFQFLEDLRTLDRVIATTPPSWGTPPPGWPGLASSPAPGLPLPAPAKAKAKAKKKAKPWTCARAKARIDAWDKKRWAANLGSTGRTKYRQLMDAEKAKMKAKRCSNIPGSTYDSDEGRAIASLLTLGLSEVARAVFAGEDEDLGEGWLFS